MYIFLKYTINFSGLLRNRSQFRVFIVIFVFSASKFNKKWLMLPQKQLVTKNLLPSVIIPVPPRH